MRPRLLPPQGLLPSQGLLPPQGLIPGNRREHSRFTKTTVTPICRCRVLYLGSAVPHVTKDGLQGIQEPLRELYPVEGALGAKGIDSWLSVWSNGFLLENVDEHRKKVTRFFPVDTLHYCAAVRYVLVPAAALDSTDYSGGVDADAVQQRFLPLDSPFARNPNPNHPPLFAAILRRTSGIKVLECHMFICKRETAANALVRCSFHAYADSTYAKHLQSGSPVQGSNYSKTNFPPMMTSNYNGGSSNATDTGSHGTTAMVEVSEDSINSIERVDGSEWRELRESVTSRPTTTNGHVGNKNRKTYNPMTNGGVRHTSGNSSNENGVDEISVITNDENHKVWNTSKSNYAANNSDQLDGTCDYGSSTLRSFRSNSSQRQRPRQLLSPASPPPPPIIEETTSNGHKNIEKKKRNRSKGREIPLNGYQIKSNGTNGQGTRNKSFPLPPHPMMIPMPPMQMPDSKMKKKKIKAGTFGGGRSKQKLHIPPPWFMYGGAPPFPQFGPMQRPSPMIPPHMMYGMTPMSPQPQPGSRMATEEPIYMPHNTRPMSPVASYQPGHFPHEAYYNNQQYATIDRANRNRNAQSKKRSNLPSSDSNEGEVESEGYGVDTGIYKKGHINERAFSYSIRNEHRTRSYGSLVAGANGGGSFDGDVNVGVDTIDDNKSTSKNKIRQREDYAQMMEDLDLHGDRIERSAVPNGLYKPQNVPHTRTTMLTGLGRRKR